MEEQGGDGSIENGLETISASIGFLQAARATSRTPGITGETSISVTDVVRRWNLRATMQYVLQALNRPVSREVMRGPIVTVFRIVRECGYRDAVPIVLSVNKGAVAHVDADM